jgi:hypothetical protein
MRQTAVEYAQINWVPHRSLTVAEKFNRQVFGDENLAAKGNVRSVGVRKSG